MTALNRRRSHWTETEAAGAMYWRVRCNVEGCDFEVVKASPRNVQLAQVAHQSRNHWGHPWQFSVIPLKREDAAR